MNDFKKRDKVSHPKYGGGKIVQVYVLEEDASDENVVELVCAEFENTACYFENQTGREWDWNTRTLSEIRITKKPSN